jgi:hypothetical protein
LYSTALISKLNQAPPYCSLGFPPIAANSNIHYSEEIIFMLEGSHLPSEYAPTILVLNKKLGPKYGLQNWTPFFGPHFLKFKTLREYQVDLINHISD